jgi:hypothetical protein
MASRDVDSRLPISLFLSRVLCILLSIASLVLGISLGILPPRFIDDWWGPQGPQLPSLSIAFVKCTSSLQMNFNLYVQLVAMLVLDTEESVRLLVRHIKKRQTWQVYPGFIVICDFLVGLAVLLAVMAWQPRTTSGHRTTEFRQLEDPHNWIGFSCA